MNRSRDVVCFACFPSQTKTASQVLETAAPPPVAVETTGCGSRPEVGANGYKARERDGEREGQGGAGRERHRDREAGRRKTEREG